MLTKESRIGVIGSGAMGSGIAQVAATAGHNVLIFDNNQASIDKSKAALNATLLKLVEKQKLEKSVADDILSRVKYISSLSEFKSCGLIIEAVIENLTIKQQLFSELEKIVSDTCIIASNTSSLSITSIASACTKPQRVIGIHFFNPAPLMPLVEIVPGLATDDVQVTISKNIIDSWGKVTVLAKDTPGFIVNRVARPFYGEALRLYEEGFGDFATIDWALKKFGGFKMGPFELMDFIGNDINYTVTETVWTQLFFDQRYKPFITQRRLFEAKRFGRKSGHGYYNYADGVVMPAPTTDEELGKDIFFRILIMLINEAADALYFKVASRDDIDLAMTKGVNYPKGLLKWADEIGIKRVTQSLQHLYDEYGEDRYRPSFLLKRMTKEGVSFY